MIETGGVCAKRSHQVIVEKELVKEPIPEISKKKYERCKAT